MFLFTFVRLCRVLPGFTGFYRVLSSVTGFLFDCIGFDQVLTGFYWVLLGFTGFYWVVLGFTGFLCDRIGFDQVSTGFYWILLGFTEFDWV